MADDSHVVTGAMDSEVQLHEISQGFSSGRVLRKYRCHSDRVKDVVVDYASPNLFWSIGEDGKCCQLDIRENHRCSARFDKR